MERIVEGEKHGKNADSVLLKHGHAFDRILPCIDFADDREGCLFTATVHRTPVEVQTLTPGSRKSSEEIIVLIREDPWIAAREIAERMGITQRAEEKQIAALKKVGRLRRVGPAKGGGWEPNWIQVR